MTEFLPPFMAYVIGALLLPFVPNDGRRATLLLLVPIIGAAMIWSLPEGSHGMMTLAGLEVDFLRVDKLSTVFGLVFSLAAFLALLYAWHVRDTIQQLATLLYAGSAIGAVFAGDFASLFIFWEGTAIASVFLIWARRTDGAYHTGMRYLIIQIASGVILMAGAVLFHRETGSLAFNAMELGSFATWLILIAFGIKCAFPLLHNWLPDAYPAATITGTVVLSSFTTKLAVYTLARGFPGTELLIYIGATMAIFPLLYAFIENDMRRVLAYCLNNQLGFMVVGVGIGTELALNGTAAHAIAHILYKSLLFMGIGAILFRTGTSKATELGGLHRTMPLTFLLCLVGALSVSAPFFSGFTTKSLILSSAAYEGRYVVWGILVFATAAVFHIIGLKMLSNAFFGEDRGLRPKEAPKHMLWAMGITASLCFLVGVYPDPVYALLPYPVEYEAYTLTHIVTYFQLIFFSALVFVVLKVKGLYPKEISSVNLDFDWTYRKVLPAILRHVNNVLSVAQAAGSRILSRKGDILISGLYRSHGPEGRMAKVWPTGSMVLWIAIILTATLIVNFL